MSNNYLLFAGPDYYPLGGVEDLVGIYTSVEKAKKVAEEGDPYDFQWIQIVDRDTLEGVLYGMRDMYDEDTAPEWSDKSEVNTILYPKLSAEETKIEKRRKKHITQGFL